MSRDAFSVSSEIPSGAGGQNSNPIAGWLREGRRSKVHKRMSRCQRRCAVRAGRRRGGAGAKMGKEENVKFKSRVGADRDPTRQYFDLDQIPSFPSLVPSPFLPHHSLAPSHSRCLLRLAVPCPTLNVVPQPCRRTFRTTVLHPRFIWMLASYYFWPPRIKISPSSRLHPCFTHSGDTMLSFGDHMFAFVYRLRACRAYHLVARHRRSTAHTSFSSVGHLPADVSKDEDWPVF